MKLYPKEQFSRLSEALRSNLVKRKKQEKQRVSQERNSEELNFVEMENVLKKTLRKF